jgi:hypothetical protein
MSPIFCIRRVHIGYPICVALLNIIHIFHTYRIHIGYPICTRYVPDSIDFDQCYYVAEYLKEVGLLNKEDLDSDYPVKPFQRSHPQRNNNSARFDRLEEELNETRDNMNLLTEEFQKLNIRKCSICKETGHSKGNCPNKGIARSNFTRSYFTPLTLIVPQCTPPGSDHRSKD